MTLEGKTLFVLLAADRALDESLRIFGGIAFIAFMPPPLSYQIPLWVLPVIFLTMFASPFLVRLLPGRRRLEPAPSAVAETQQRGLQGEFQGGAETGGAAQAAKRAALEALVFYSLMAFIGSLPEPIGYPVAVWLLPAAFLGFFLYEWGMGRRRARE